MSYIGDIRLGDTFDTKFCTVTTTGAPTTLAGTPVISAYVGNNTTQLTAGITLSVDFDGVTGLHNVRVVATSGNGYATASNYQLVITTGTVGGTSVVGYVVAEFSIEARSALMPTTAARTVVIDAAGLADANMVKSGPTGSGTAQTARDLGASVLLSTGTGTGQLDFTSGVVKANLAQILGTALTETAGLLAGGFKKFFNIASPVSTMDVVARVTLTDTVTTYTGNTVQTGDSFARIGAAGAGLTNIDLPDQTMNITGNITGNLSGSVGSVTGAVGSVTGAVGSVTGAVGSVTGNVGGNVTGSVGSVVGAVGSVAAGGITASSIAADAIGASELAADAVTEIVTAVFARAFSAAYGSFTFDELTKLMAAALLGKCSGMGTATGTFRNLADNADAIVATIDASGNRTAVTRTP